MTPEEKQILLLQELCMRLQYKPYIEVTECEKITKKAESYTVQLFGVETPHHNLPGTITTTIAMFKYDPEIIKPYLRPMSSMTEEEWKNFRRTLDGGDCEINDDGETDFIMLWFEPCQLKSAYNCLDYLNSIHIDYRGLIPMGLALEAPEGMYNN